jgi:hypothetical protein
MTRAKEKFDATRLLDLVPAVNEAVRVERHGRTIIVFVPIARRFWMRAPFTWLLPLRSEKGVALDALGGEVFEACDGRRTVEEIVEAFAEKHRLRFHEARASVLAFLRSLSERNLLVMALKEGEHP